MSYYRICKFCGDRLDPEERCMCRERKEQKEPVAVVPQKMEYPKERRRNAG